MRVSSTLRSLILGGTWPRDQNLNNLIYSAQMIIKILWNNYEYLELVHDKNNTQRKFFTAEKI